jgi:phosphoribosyl 1,2-cyclic phosphodiesterase
MISKKYNIPVYANFETWQAMREQADKINLENKKIFENDNNFEIGNLLIHPFSTPHDAANPCGFNIFSGNKKISIATDLGHMEDTIFENLKGSSFVLLEANYDPEILKVSRYPFMLKQRISGPHGHLSNSTSGKTVAKLMNYDLKEVMLGHLSKENNFPELAYQTVAEELMSQNKDMGTISLSVASRVNPSKIVNI